MDSSALQCSAISSSVPPTPNAAFSKRSAIEVSTLFPLLFAASQAPSGGNQQPWKWQLSLDGQSAILQRDEQRSDFFGFTDYHNIASWISIGAALENALIQADQMKLMLDVSVEQLAAVDNLLYPDIQVRLTLQSSGGGAVRGIGRGFSSSSGLGRLAPWIPLRHTSRKPARIIPNIKDVRANLLLELSELVSESGAEFHSITSTQQKRSLARFLADSTSFRMRNSKCHSELYNEVSIEPDAVAEHGNIGLDMRSLEMGSFDNCCFKMLKSPSLVSCLMACGMSKSIYQRELDTIRRSIAIGLIRLPFKRCDCASEEHANDPFHYKQHFLEGGRILQRVWLLLARRGYNLYPCSSTLFMLYYLNQRVLPIDRIRHFRLDPMGVQNLERLQKSFLSIFPTVSGSDPDLRGDVFLFIINKADPASVRALKRPVEDTVQFEAEHKDRDEKPIHIQNILNNKMAN
jgi:hypothetical protein